MRYATNNAAYKKRSKRSRLRKRVAVTALVLAAAVFVAAILTRPHDRTLSAASAAPAAKPVPVRRVAAAWTPGQRSNARSAVHAALVRALAGARDWSCAVLAQDGSSLYDDRGTNAVVPASVQKILITDAALGMLGPKFRYATLFAVSAPPQDGTIAGDLWIAASGDPSLRSGDLWRGVTSLRAQNVRAIQGGVVVDPSAIAGEEINPLWNSNDANEDFMAATSGASIDEDTVEFRITGSTDGSPARIDVTPQTPLVKYSASVSTGGGDDVTVAGTDRPNEFRVYGSIPPGSVEHFWVPVHGIPQYAAAVTSSLLKHAGIEVGHAPLTGTVPLDTLILWEHHSQPLAQLLKHMLIFSDNHYAEQFLRTLGGQNGAADDAGGLAAEQHVLTSQAIPIPGLHLVDGSGLAHANRIAAQTLAHILSWFDSGPDGNVLYGMLARGGKDGTLKHYHFNAAQGRVRAKSGHLSDASSLAGYVETRKHGRVAFAFMINGSPGDPDASITDAVDALSQR